MGCTGWTLTRGRAPQDGMTPLHFAVMNRLPEVAQALLDAGADITAKNNVSEGRVGGEGQRIRERRGFGRL